MPNLTLEEQETHLNMVADDRSVWFVYSDDYIMQARLEKIGAVFVKASGPGKHYTLASSQILFRKVPKPLSEERRAVLSEKMKEVRKSRK